MLRALADELRQSSVVQSTVSYHRIAEAAAGQLRRSPLFQTALQQLVSSEVEVSSVTPLLLFCWAAHESCAVY
jgi:hypothetical protein